MSLNQLRDEMDEEERAKMAAGCLYVQKWSANAESRKAKTWGESSFPLQGGGGRWARGKYNCKGGYSDSKPNASSSLMAQV